MEPTSLSSRRVKINILKGLKTFNARINDHSNIYPNYGHGFVDPLKRVSSYGSALGSPLIACSRGPRSRSGDLLSPLIRLRASSIPLLRPSFITKAPNYTRLLDYPPLRRLFRCRGRGNHRQPSPCCLPASYQADGFPPASIRGCFCGISWGDRPLEPGHIPGFRCPKDKTIIRQRHRQHRSLRRGSKPHRRLLLSS